MYCNSGYILQKMPYDHLFMRYSSPKIMNRSAIWQYNLILSLILSDIFEVTGSSPFFYFRLRFLEWLIFAHGMIDDLIVSSQVSVILLSWKSIFCFQFIEKLLFCCFHPDTSEFGFFFGFIVMATSQMLYSISILKGIAIWRNVNRTLSAISI